MERMRRTHRRMTGSRRCAPMSSRAGTRPCGTWHGRARRRIGFLGRRDTATADAALRGYRRAIDGLTLVDSPRRGGASGLVGRGGYSPTTRTERARRDSTASSASATARRRRSCRTSGAWDSRFPMTSRSSPSMMRRRRMPRSPSPPCHRRSARSDASRRARYCGCWGAAATARRCGCCCSRSCGAGVERACPGPGLATACMIAPRVIG